MDNLSKDERLSLAEAEIMEELENALYKMDNPPLSSQGGLDAGIKLEEDPLWGFALNRRKILEKYNLTLEEFASRQKNE